MHDFFCAYRDRLRNASPIKHYGQLIDAHIAARHPGRGLDDLKRKIEVVGRQFDFLPNTLPYLVAEIRSAEPIPAISCSKRLKLS